MQEIFNFVKNNWQLIVGVLTFIASVVVAAIRKRPISDVCTNLYKWCIEAINLVEASNISSGNSKLNEAIRLVRYAFERLYPGVNFSGTYEKTAEVFIEDILTTPQKKER